MRLLPLLVVAVLLTMGCGTTHDVFTNPTRKITIERQDFINTFATIKVLWKGLRANAELACASAPAGEVGPCFSKLRDIDAQAKALSVQIEAKILVPESEIDWEVVKDLLGAIVGLVP